MRNLDAGVKEALRRRARGHGRSMEEEARVILAQAVQNEDLGSTDGEPGLGSRMAALFAGLGLDEPIETWRGHEAQPADFSA